MHAGAGCQGSTIAKPSDKVVSCAQVDDQMKFYLSAAAGALGVVVTLLFIPEISTLNLAEGDLRWDAIKRGGATWQSQLLNKQFNARIAVLSTRSPPGACIPLGPRGANSDTVQSTSH